MTEITYGDEVLVISGGYSGRMGAIVGMNHQVSPSVFTVEFADGSDAEIPLECLKKVPDTEM